MHFTEKIIASDIGVCNAEICAMFGSRWHLRIEYVYVSFHHFSEVPYLRIATTSFQLLQYYRACFSILRAIDECIFKAYPLLPIGSTLSCA